MNKWVVMILGTLLVSACATAPNANIEAKNSIKQTPILLLKADKHYTAKLAVVKLFDHPNSINFGSIRYSKILNATCGFVRDARLPKKSDRFIYVGDIGSVILRSKVEPAAPGAFDKQWAVCLANL